MIAENRTHRVFLGVVHLIAIRSRFTDAMGAREYVTGCLNGDASNSASVLSIGLAMHSSSSMP